MKTIKNYGTGVLIAFVLSVMPAAIFAQQNKTILAIFAHPDDEETVTPVLARYADSGVSIFVCIVTDGRYGTSERFGVDDPDSLSAIRRKEIACVTERLGIHPPILFNLPDQLRMQEGMDSMGLLLADMHTRIFGLFEKIKPDVVITWGPSGITGHTDHRSVGNVVTEVFSSKKWVKPARLYYTELVSGSLPDSIKGIATVDSAYLDVRIAVSPQNIAKARKAWSCYLSQYTPETARQWQNVFWDTQKGTLYFRSYVPTGKIEHSLFP